jgi:hypothetical protein
MTKHIRIIEKVKTNIRDICKQRTEREDIGERKEGAACQK